MPEKHLLGIALLRAAEQEFKLGLELEQGWNLVLTVLGSVLWWGLESKFSVLVLYYIQGTPELQTGTAVGFGNGAAKACTEGLRMN